MKDIKTIATKLGLDLTRKGNLELGSHDAGYYGQPGDGIAYEHVLFYALADGEFRAVIDDRHGSNQGYFEQLGGDKIILDAPTLEEAIELAEADIEDREDAEKLRRACRIAAAEARKTWRRIEEADEAEPTVRRAVEILMGVIAGETSTGRAREMMREEGFPEEAWRLVMAPPAE